MHEAATPDELHTRSQLASEVLHGIERKSTVSTMLLLQVLFQVPATDELQRNHLYYIICYCCSIYEVPSKVRGDAQSWKAWSKN